MVITKKQNDEFINKHVYSLSQVFDSEYSNIIATLGDKNYELFLLWKSGTFDKLSFLETFRGNEQIISYFSMNPNLGTMPALIETTKALFPNSSFSLEKIFPSEINLTIQPTQVNNVVGVELSGVNNLVAKEFAENILTKVEIFFNESVMNGTKINVILGT